MPETKMKELTVQEVASRIDKHYVTTLKLIHSGKIRGVRKGGQWYVTEEEVERFNREGNYVPPEQREEQEKGVIESE